MPHEMPEVKLAAVEGGLGIASLLKGAGLVGSNSEAFRMIKQGAVRIDGERVADRDLVIKAPGTRIYQVGKRRFARVTVV
jgi:tyrosyl-tRNA synthetase